MQNRFRWHAELCGFPNVLLISLTNEKFADVSRLFQVSRSLDTLSIKMYVKQSIPAAWVRLKSIFLMGLAEWRKNWVSNLQNDHWLKGWKKIGCPSKCIHGIKTDLTIKRHIYSFTRIYRLVGNKVKTSIRRRWKKKTPSRMVWCGCMLRLALTRYQSNCSASIALMSVILTPRRPFDEATKIVFAVPIYWTFEPLKGE